MKFLLLLFFFSGFYANSGSEDKNDIIKNDKYNFIRIGSTKADVLRILGSPDTTYSYVLCEDVHEKWGYGYSSIDFKNGRVDGWYEDANTPLNIDLGA